MTFNQIRSMILILISAISIGTVLLLAVYCLPTERMFEHIKSSKDFMMAGEVPRWSKSVIHTSLDNFADAIMLMKAAYPVKNVIESAMLNPSWGGNYSPAEGLVKIIDLNLYNAKPDPNIGFNENEFIYPRYWHGYLTVMKPMLLLFKSEQLRVINLYIQFFLVLTAMILMYKKLGIYYTYAFGLVALAINPVTTVLAFQHTNVFCTMLLTVIIILLFNDKLKKGNRYAYFFMIIGIITAYFDLLTYPMVPLGIGLTLYLALNKDLYSKTSEKNLILQLLNKCFSWSFGYIGMWSGKIILATILTNQNIIADALNELIIRTSHHEGHGFEGEPITIIGTILKNGNSICEGPIKIIFLLTFIYLIYLIFVKYKDKFKFDKLKFTAFAFTTSLPFLWYAATCNHSFVHNHFAYRELTVALFGSIAFIIESIPALKQTENN